MQPQHPAGRRVGNRIYYGSYHGTKVQCTKCLLVTFTVLFLLVGVIVTIVGHTIRPFWSDTTFCSFCEEDNRATLRNAANCRVVGPIFITVGFFLMLFTIFYFKKKKSEGMAAHSGGSSQPAQTTMTYNQPSQSVNTQYPATGQMQPQQPYPAAQPYPSGIQPYPTGFQPYPGSQSQPSAPPAVGSQQYPPAQQAYPPPNLNQDYLPPPPSYNDVVAGSNGQ